MPQKGYTTTLTMKLEADIAELKKGLKNAKAQTKKFSKGMSDLTKVIAGAFAVGAVKNFIKETLKAFDIQAKAERTLLTALKGRRDVTDRLINQAQELQKETLFGDEETIKAQALIAAFVKEEDQIKRIIPLVQDLAAAKGMDLAGAADLVSKTLGSSTNAMSRYGIQVEGAVGSTERLESLAMGLSNAFEGQAKAAAEAGTGGLTQLSNIYGDLMETIGGILAPSKLWVKTLQNIVISVDDLLKQPLSEKYEEERVELNLLVDSITGANVTNESRLRLIKELQSKYPDFIGNIDAETVSNGDLETALIKVNEQLRQKILIQLKEEETSEIIKKQVALRRLELKLIKDIQAGQQQGSQVGGLGIDRAAEAYNRLNGSLELNRQKQKDLVAELKKVNDEYDDLIPGIESATVVTEIKTEADNNNAEAWQRRNFIYSAGFEIGVTSNEILKNQTETLRTNTGVIIENAEQTSLWGGLVSNVFSGMSNVITNSLKSTENVFQAFGTFFADMIKGMLIKVVAMTLAAIALVAVLSLIPGLGAGIDFTKGIGFAKNLKGVMGSIGGFANGGVSSGGLAVVGERGKEIVSMPQGSRVMSHPDTMKAIGGGGGSQRIEVVGVIRGEDIWLANNEASRKLGNTRG